MIRDCQEQGTSFGVIGIREGLEVGRAALPFSVGTLAQIHELEALDDGRFNLVVAGASRFRVESMSLERSYLVGSISYLEDTRGDEAAIPEPGAARRARFTRVHGGAAQPRRRRRRGEATSDSARRPGAALLPDRGVAQRRGQPAPGAARGGLGVGPAAPVPAGAAPRVGLPRPRCWPGATTTSCRCRSTDGRRAGAVLPRRAQPRWSPAEAGDRSRHRPGDGRRPARVWRCAPATSTRARRSSAEIRAAGGRRDRRGRQRRPCRRTPQ